jgi:D-arabinose 1-dehydrogenase-like Zn-dependent alcohol dehydrogenase
MYAFLHCSGVVSSHHRTGQIGGYEGAGEVVERGEGVTNHEIGAKAGIQYAKAMDAKILAVDAGSKEELCRSVGANAFVYYSAAPGEYIMSVVEFTSGGARVALLCSPSVESYNMVSMCMGFRGVVVGLAVTVPEGLNIVNPLLYVHNELKYMGKLVRPLAYQYLKSSF